MNTQKKEIDIIDLLTALHAGRWLIIAAPWPSASWPVASASSCQRNTSHRANSAPREKKEILGFSSMLSALPIPALRLGERGTPSDISSPPSRA